MASSVRGVRRRSRILVFTVPNGMTKGDIRLSSACSRGTEKNEQRFTQKEECFIQREANQRTCLLPTTSLPRLRLREQRIVQFRVYHYALDHHLVRFLVALDGSLENMGNHQPLHRLVITQIDKHGMHLPIHSARSSVDLHLEEVLRIDPDVLHLAALHGQL